MLRLHCSPSTQLYLRSTVDTALQISRQLATDPIVPNRQHHYYEYSLEDQAQLEEDLRNRLLDGDYTCNP
jgi:hypothetical protein